MRSVLMLCYYYPPLGGIGSQRSQKFAFYLPECGWRPIVLTPAQGSYLIDATLDDGTSRGIEVVRTRYVNLSSILKRTVRNGTSANGSANGDNGHKGGSIVDFMRRSVRNWLYIPDGQIGWYPYATSAGRRAIESSGADVIYSSSFPVTAHLAARNLKQTTGRPWIADFRDLWTENHYLEYTSTLRKRIDQMIESGLLEAADVLVTVSDEWAGTLRKMTGGRKRVEVIRNGFDAGEFATIEPRRPQKWTITYVGNFYGAKQDPTVFFEALRRVIDSGQVAESDVEVKIVGDLDAYAQSIVNRLGLARVTRFTGFVSHAESLSHQVGSSLLLMILHGDKSNRGHVPGKLYEYLGARRPIMAIMPAEFEAARLIRETRAGVTIDAIDSAGIDRFLIESYEGYKSNDSDSWLSGDLSLYERKRGAERLAEIFSECLSGQALRASREL